MNIITVLVIIKTASAQTKPPRRFANSCAKYRSTFQTRRLPHELNTPEPLADVGENAAVTKHGFESRREGPKEVRSSLRRQSFSSDSKREVIAPALGRTRRGFAPATRQLREAESRMRGAGEGEGIAHILVKDRRPFFR